MLINRKGAILFGLTAGMGMLFSAPAHAGTAPPLTPCLMSQTLDVVIAAGGCSVSDKNYIFTAASYTGSKAASEIVVSPGASDVFHTINFQASGMTDPFWTGAGNLNYTIEVNTNSTQVIAMQTAGFTSSVPGSAYDWDNNAGAPHTGTCSGAAPGITDCTVAGLDFTPFTESTTVTNTWNVTAGGLTQITNSHNQTPGPLPILGAGAAFGFSRKLRNRIKASA
jgi:hypothetical protein